MLVDDHHLMRAGLAFTVDRLGGYRVTRQAGNGREMIEQLEKAALDGQPPPEIVIVDLNMPVMDGYATVAWLRENAPDILTLVLTFDATDEAMLKAVHAGARGFVLKSVRPSVLKNALDSVVTTGYYYAEEARDKNGAPPAASLTMAADSEERARILAQMTPREREFLQLVCNEAEYTYEQIATRMNLQRRSVENFRIGLFEKFNIKSKTGLVLFAMRWRLVDDNGG